MGKRGRPTKYSNLSKGTTMTIRGELVEDLRWMAKCRKVSIQEQIRDGMSKFMLHLRTCKVPFYNPEYICRYGGLSPTKTIPMTFSEDMFSFMKESAKITKQDFGWFYRYALEWYVDGFKAHEQLHFDGFFLPTQSKLPGLDYPDLLVCQTNN